MRSRISAASLVAVAVLAAAALFHGSPGADATQGQPVVAGVLNTETSATTFHNTDWAAECVPATSVGVFACGNTGVAGRGAAVGVDGRGAWGVYGETEGSGNVVGVQGFTASAQGTAVRGENSAANGTGIRGNGGTGGTGVHGAHFGDAGIGVQGQGFGEGTGVYGVAEGSGVGVLAASNDGTAMKVDGKAEFSRSGRAVVAGTAASPKSFVVVSGVPITAKSLVLVTPQKSVSGVFVQGAVPNVADGKVKIVLNKAVTVSYPVAWFVLEKPVQH